ncbi:putative baseplate assembly protein [Microbulbifer taiwanensis]|uniref:Baseplate assembly protein n=1 Tax=Microbulbifer taiwanensis TaxID=986746 RepID=A0ABW1YGF0_9GAMM|nr:putative baseplate assembly protein [Microbulbifer taiwanensis]
MKRIDSPVIDPRNTEAVARQTAQLAEQLSGWSPGDKADAGTALIGAFATLAQQVISRLNQMPNRHFLAYLRMLGLQPQPPRAAEVPLTFTAAAGAQGVRVPAGTQVRGQHADGSSTTFYTQGPLELLPNREPVLWRAITYQPRGDNTIDCVSINTAVATGLEPGYYSLFTADTAVEHAVYLAADEVIVAVGSGDAIQLSIAFASGDDAEHWSLLQDISDPESDPCIVWEYFSSSADDWTSLAIDSDSVSIDGDDFQFNVTLPADIVTCSLSVAGTTTSAFWIRARLTAWPEDTDTPAEDAAIPAWCGVTLSATESVDVSELALEQVLFNGVPIDTSKDYYPLGRQPAFNDACTLVLGSLPSDESGRLIVTVTVSDEAQSEDPDPCGNDNPNLSWEVGSGDSWDAAVPTFDPSGTGDASVSALKASGTAEIPLPADTDQPSLRIRLASGNYGTGITVSDGSVIDDGYRPPILQSISLGATYTPSATPICVIDNGEGRQLEDFAQPVAPFLLRADAAPTFYLAFGESLGQTTVSIYLEVGPLSLDGETQSALSAVQGGGNPAQVQWQYMAVPGGTSADTDWKPLEVADGTHNFTQSGFLQFVAPADLARSAQFGSAPLYWLRATVKSGSYSVPPRGGRLLPNSVAASNARLIRNEVLGSSRQTPGQTFSLTQAPILANAELLVRESTAPSASDSAQLRAESEPLAVAPVVAGSDGTSETWTAADLDAAWVRWKQVGSFAASGPRDRHYTLDHQDGTVTFGDGKNGMVPPAGENNIVMARYSAGGGAAGNLPAGAINQLVTAVTQVAAVDNAIASSGGADGEDSDAVMDWGPKVLRHRGRATARQDYEDLVRQGFPQVAKVRAITPVFDPTENPGLPESAGHVLVIVVPGDNVDRPAPSVGLLQQVGDFLRARMPPAVQLKLSGPDWLQVDVTVTVNAKRMDRADAVKKEVEQALRRFLNPLSGGFDRGGWALGQMVYDSDLTRYLLALPGVDSLSDLTVTRTPAISAPGSTGAMPEDTADQKLTVILVCSGDHTVTVQAAGSL